VGAEISEQDGSFGAQNLVAHSLAVLVRVNAELLDDAPIFGAVLDNSLAQATALALDYAGLYGNGVGQPLGLRNNPYCQRNQHGHEQRDADGL
jgi:HK97 family phage major capsid protein